MYKLEKTRREDLPSFSSTLLDKIYRSIDEGGERKDSDMKFYTETTMKKQSRINAKCDRALEKELEKEQNQNRHRALKESEKVRTQRKAHRDYDDLEQDVQFFSSTSSSSDSSSGLLSSSSDTESMYATKSRVSCFAPSRPKPVRTSVATTERSEKTRSAIGSDNEESLIKSKSRAMKIYNNLKKVKQPISPGGKLSSFLNSLFTTKKTTTSSFHEDVNVNQNAERRNASTCSSASSFSRSCLSKNSPSTREKLRNGVKRTVRFYPVSVIVDEDSQPCGHKAVSSVPPTWKIGSKKKVVEEEEEVIEKSRRVEEAAREFLREYHRNNENLRRKIEEDEQEDEDDDVSSCSSSDLFELDHLAVIGKDNRYCEELPVFETTRFTANSCIL